jgi:hypothetical protein
VKDIFCKGTSISSLFAIILVSSMVSKSIYEKIIAILTKDTSFMGKVFLSIKISITCYLIMLTSIILAKSANDSQMSILFNLAGLMIINEFDKILSNLFEIKL